MPEPDAALTAALRRAATDTAHIEDGEVARYIPTLANAPPDRFALAACTATGGLESVGDAEERFTLQSTSKPFSYAAALCRLGRDELATRVGVEPTGRSFDSIVRLETGSHRPHNPMVNAGAIAVAGLLATTDSDAGRSPIADLLALFGRLAGADLQVDSATYLSERDTGHLNRSIAYLLRHHGVFEGEVAAALDLYFQLCAVQVSCRDLAVMAGTLATGGCNPLTGERVLPMHVTRDVLAVMSTSGLYDAAGRFLYEVGLPAKSGVSGAVLAVVPGRMGLAAWSPRLDERGNPRRGVAAIRKLSAELDLHVFSPRPAATPRSGMPDPELLQSLVAEVGDGPELGVCAVGVDGETVHAGAQQTFPMQATANAFAHALALERCGAERVEALAGVETSGNPFHEVFLDPLTGRPHNPLGNAGAIALCQLVPGDSLADRVATQLAAFASLAGAPRLEVDAVVLHAEHRDGDRNRAIGSMLQAHGALTGVDDALEVYFHQCSVRVTCSQLATMAAVLARGGLDVDGATRLLRPQVVRRTLSVMYTCGLHDESGRFAYDVGVPAKSGISGAIVAVVPGRMGLCVHSIPVNDHGTSIAGRRLLERLSRALELSAFALPPAAGRG